MSEGCRAWVTTAIYLSCHHLLVAAATLLHTDPTTNSSRSKLKCFLWDLQRWIQALKVLGSKEGIGYRQRVNQLLCCLCCREPFKVYQLDKRATLAPQLTTFHGKKEPGSASIIVTSSSDIDIFKKVEVNFLLRSSIFLEEFNNKVFLSLQILNSVEGAG